MQSLMSSNIHDNFQFDGKTHLQESCKRNVSHPNRLDQTKIPHLTYRRRLDLLHYHRQAPQEPSIQKQPQIHQSIQTAMLQQKYSHRDVKLSNWYSCTQQRKFTDDLGFPPLTDHILKVSISKNPQLFLYQSLMKPMHKSRCLHFLVNLWYCKFLRYSKRHLRDMPATPVSQKVEAPKTKLQKN